MASAAPALFALTGQRVPDRSELRRRLYADPDGAVHRAIVAWLDVPAAARPPALRRLSHRQPSRQATRSLLRVLGMTWRAYGLFGDLALTRRWLATPQALAGGPRGFPLADLMHPVHRRALTSAIQRTAHGIF